MLLPVLPSAEKELVIILDFEKIVAEIAPETTIQVTDVDKMGRPSYLQQSYCDRGRFHSFK